MRPTSLHGVDSDKSPRSIVYRALLDPTAVAKWKVPTGMTSHGHLFDAREGGSIRISVTYDAPTGTGKTTAHTDTYRGRVAKLMPNDHVVEVDEFEITDPALRGEMTITISSLSAADTPCGSPSWTASRSVPPFAFWHQS